MLAGQEYIGELGNGYWISGGNHEGKNPKGGLNLDDTTILKRVLKEIRYKCFD
jgi:hypothetical protein